MINQQRAKSNKLCVQVSSFPFSIVVFFHSYLWTFKFVTRIFRESCCFLWFHLLFCAGNWRTAGKKLIPFRVPGMARRVKTTCWEGKHFAFLVSCCILLARRFNRPHYEPNTGAMHLNSQTQNTSFLQGCQKNLALSLSLPIFPPNESNLGFKPFRGGTKESIIRPVTCWQRHELMRTSNIQRMIFFFQNFLLASGAFQREERFPLFIVWI